MRNIFEPQVNLSEKSNGDYTLNAVTLAPNSCYVAGKAEQVPLEEVDFSEKLAVMLHIKYIQGVCLQHHIKPVRHSLPNLKLKEGTSKIVTFAVIDEKLVGSSSIDLKPTGLGSGMDMLIDTSDWIAWIAGSSLYVQGTATLPNPGYTTQLIKADKQEDPKSLTLELQISEPYGDRNWPQYVRNYPVQYEDQNYVEDYKYVTIRLANVLIARVDIEAYLQFTSANRASADIEVKTTTETETEENIKADIEIRKRFQRSCCWMGYCCE